MTSKKPASDSREYHHNDGPSGGTKNPLQMLKWVHDAQPKKKQATKYTSTQLNEMKRKRQEFFALFPHRYFPTSKEIKERKIKNKRPPLSEYQSKIQKLFSPIEWYNDQLDRGHLDVGLEFSRQFDHTEGSLKTKWLSWKQSGRDDLMPIGRGRFYNGLFVLGKEDFNFTALDSDGIEKTVGLIQNNETKAKFDDDSRISCPHTSSSLSVARPCTIQQLCDTGKAVQDGAAQATKSSVHPETADETMQHPSLDDQSVAEHRVGTSPEKTGCNDSYILDSDESISCGLEDVTHQRNKHSDVVVSTTRNSRLCLCDSEDEAVSHDINMQCKPQAVKDATSRKSNIKLCFYDSDESS